jgi:hypothetical protein
LGKKYVRFCAKSCRIIELAHLPYLSNLKVKYQLSKKMGCVAIYSNILASAILDRVVHYSNIAKINEPSFRDKKSKRNEEVE